MLRQLFWTTIICIWQVNAHDVLQRRCHTEQCKEVEQYLISHVNTYTEPCENFYEYSCKNNITGGREGHTLGVDYYYREGSQFFDHMKHKLANDFHYFLTDYHNKEQQNQALTWEQAVYAKCRKFDINNERNEHYYMNQLGDGRRLHSHEKMDYYSEKQIESWTVTDRKYAKRGIGFAFFDFNVVTKRNVDMFTKDERRYIQISPMPDSPLTILDFFRTYYNVTHDTHIRKYVLLKDFLNRLNLIMPRPNMGEETEEEIARNGIENTIWDWQKEWNMYAADASHLNWLHHFNHIGFKNLRSNDVILIKDKAYFRGLAETLHDMHTQTITDFVHLRYVMKTIGFVKQEYRKYAIIPHMEGLTCSPGLMVGVTHIFKSKYFPIADKKMMERMFSELQFHILQKLGDLKNGDRPLETRKFLKKLSNPNVVIGYPEWMNSSEAVSLYSLDKYMVSDIFFQNQMNALEALRAHQVQSYEYGNTLINEIDTYYKSLLLEDFKFDLDRKHIIIPLSLFNEHTYRYFSTLLYNPMNYASAGTAIAQKLYFTYLALISYGLESSRIPQCIEDNARDPYVNRNEHILESTSWLLAVRDSFEIWPDHNGLPIKFEKFGAISPKRLFYITFAQSVCQLPNSEKKGPASHINFAVKNSKGFHEAFRCEEWGKRYEKISSLTKLRTKAEIHEHQLCNPLLQY